MPVTELKYGEILELKYGEILDFRPLPAKNPVRAIVFDKFMRMGSRDFKSKTGACR